MKEYLNNNELDKKALEWYEQEYYWAAFEHMVMKQFPKLVTRQWFFHTNDNTVVMVPNTHKRVEYIK